MTARLAALALLALATITARADDPEINGDLAKLQGKWTAQVGPEKEIPVNLTIQGRMAHVTFTNPEGDKVDIKGELKIDEKASPKTIDWVKFKNQNGEDVPDNLGIYKLENDRFTVCAGGPNNDRPKEFAAGENGPPRLIVFERVKTKADGQ